MNKLFFLFLAFLYTIELKAQDVDVLDYEFHIELSDTSDAIKGIAMIQLRSFNRAGDISLDLVQKKANEKGMAVQSVHCDAVEKWEQKDDKLFLHFYKSPESIPDTSYYQIWIYYSGIPDDGLVISKNKYGQRTFFADNWPNRAHHWLPCNDRPDDKARVVFNVLAPKKYSVIGNGELVNTDYENSILPDKNFRYTRWSSAMISLSTKIMVIGVASFAIKDYSTGKGEVPQSAWVYPKDSSKGYYDFAVGPDIVRFFSRFIAPFPFNKLAHVQSKTIFGGMENASCIFYDENYITGDRKHEDVVAHEIAHQWFGDMVSEKSFSHVWLSEGFATFFTNFYLQNKYGDTVYKKRLRAQRQQVIAFAQQGRSIVDTAKNLMSLLNANSYQKGGWVLHMMRTQTGDSIFFKIIRTYYEQYKGSNADTRDFENIVEKVTGKDWKPFFEQWLYQPFLPELTIDKKIEKEEIKLKIIQSHHVLHFPLEIGLMTKDGLMVVKKLMISEKETEFKYKGAGIKEISIDPNIKLLFIEK